MPGELVPILIVLTICAYLGWRRYLQYLERIAAIHTTLGLSGFAAYPSAQIRVSHAYHIGMGSPASGGVLAPSGCVRGDGITPNGSSRVNGGELFSRLTCAQASAMYRLAGGGRPRSPTQSLAGARTPSTRCASARCRQTG
jgi:hypothetical protein